MANLILNDQQRMKILTIVCVRVASLLHFTRENSVVVGLQPLVTFLVSAKIGNFSGFKAVSPK